MTVVAKRYLISFKNGGGQYIIAIGDRNKLDRYIAEKFGAINISSSEELDGAPIIHPDLIKNENLESQMLNQVYYM